MILGEIKGEDGLAWEIRRMCTLQSPEKVIIIVPPIEEDDVRRRWQRYCEVTEGKIPPYEGGEILLTFGANWKCQVRKTDQKREQLRIDGIKIYKEYLVEAIENSIATSETSKLYSPPRDVERRRGRPSLARRLGAGCRAVFSRVRGRSLTSRPGGAGK
jgi:hypothetical protein